MNVLFSLWQWLQGNERAVETARVAHVIDGDSIRLEDGREVRYIGVDAPELVREEPWASRARAANVRLVAGKRVRLEQEVSQVDRYGRLLRHVYVGRRWVNGWLVEQGFARARLYPPDVQRGDELMALQEKAQAEGRGMWGRKRPWWQFWR